LVVVMVLFFIVSLVAAYANRNLIFEQRTSTNQYRSSQALEAAEAGVEWALAMLNHGRITSSCANSALPADGSYRQRYVVTNAAGELTPVLRPDGTPRVQSCVFNGTGWNCDCPGDADPAPAAPGGGDVLPAFRVRLESIAPLSRPGVIRIHSVGCTRLDAACLGFNSPGISHEGRAAVRVLVALTGGAAVPPTAALMTRGAIDAGTGTYVNAQSEGSGITLHAGGAISAAGATVHSLPGTPGSASWIQDDPALVPAAAVPFSADDRFFAALFNMTPASFQQQPAAVPLVCGGGTCTAQAVRDAVAENPGRPLWLQGGLQVDSAGSIGSVAEPVLLVVNGNVDFATPGVTIHGLVYVRNAAWTVTGSGSIRGAAVGQGSFTNTGTPTIWRDAAVLDTLRWSTGSFVRLSGGWKDFE
jgi:hypothetical protein